MLELAEGLVFAGYVAVLAVSLIQLERWRRWGHRKIDEIGAAWERKAHRGGR